MNIHEYQAKSLLADYGVAVPDGGVAYTPGEAEDVAREMGGPVWVVKAQIHAGGRGAGHFADDPEGGGGVRLCKTIDAVREETGKMLGSVLVTRQTGPEGKEVKRVYIERGSKIDRELYSAILVDRKNDCLTFVGSPEGGVEIEDIAARNPESIAQVEIDPATGMQQFHGRKLAFALGLQGKEIAPAVKFFMNLYHALNELDANMIEVNPLVVTMDGDLFALDAKMGFDDNAMYRHSELGDLRDRDEEDHAEIEAARHDLNYIKLDGNIGCMVNGAGLAMATMDIIKVYGGEPANFLDVGGGANKEKVAAAFKLILSDANVEAILVNIFGGIMRCDVIAEGVVAAAKEVSLNVPLVVRLEGTNVELGKKILAESGLPIQTAEDLADGAQKAVNAAKEGA